MAARTGPVLDLACGSGGNGLLVAENGAEVHFWDKNIEFLKDIEARAAEKGLLVYTRQIDLESGRRGLFPQEYFAAVMVFRYLHRPLIPDIKSSVQSRGIIIYETFTARQADIGKPSNPDFLLKDHELPGLFSGWQIMDYYQGRLENPQRYMAGIVVRKEQSPAHKSAAQGSDDLTL